MAKDIKAFTGGMDFDSAPEYIANGDYREAYNLRNTGTSDGEAGYLTNIESTELLPISLLDGINKCIGAHGFEQTRKAYFFRFNSQNKNTLVEFDYDTQTQTVLFTNLDDSSGEDILPIRVDTYIKDIQLINDNQLLFLNGDGEPCDINVERLKSGEYGNLSKSDFLLIKAQPSKLIAPIYVSDPEHTSNLLSGNLFQFRYQYEYLDNKLSAWSSISKRVTPETAPTSDSTYNPLDNNSLQLNVDVSSNRVVKINVSARIGNGRWFLIKTINRSDAIIVSDTEIDIPNDIRESYNLGIYSFLFYNDEYYTFIDDLETDQDYDHVPLTAETLELLNGNVVALGGITEGYENTNISVSLDVTYEDRAFLDGVSDDDDYLKTNGNAFRRFQVDKPPQSEYLMYAGRAHIGYFFSGNPKNGDILTIRTRHKDTGVIGTYTYTVPLSQEDNLLAVLQSFADQLALVNNIAYQDRRGAYVGDFYGDAVIIGYIGGGGFQNRTPIYKSQVVYSGYVLWFAGLFDIRPLDSSITLINAGGGAFKSQSSIKLNSSEQFGLIYYDEYGRSSNVNTNNECVINTFSYGVTNGLTPVINWQIGHAPPSWAKSYQWCRTGNLTHQNWLYVTSKIQTDEPGYLTLNITSLKKFNEKNGVSTGENNAFTGSILSYDYSVGDRVCLHYYEDGISAPVYLDNPAIDTEVVGFTITDTDYLLKIRKTTQIQTIVGDLTGKDILIEIYTPRKKSSDTSDSRDVFYEFGERYDIINGVHSVTTGSFRDGDCYIKTREIVSAIDNNNLETYLVEDPNYSDFFISNYYSFGRPFISVSSDIIIDKGSYIRYSDVFLKDTKINLINRFYAERIYGGNAGETSSVYGRIKKIVQRGNVLVCIQELHTGYIPVYQSIIEDQVAQQQIAISDKILDKIRYSSAIQAGMGNVKESFAEDRNKVFYFIDPYLSEPIRITDNNIQTISGRMSKFFKSILQQSYKDGKKIIGYYDDFNKEYIIAIESGGDIVTQISFSEANWNIYSDFNPVAGDITITTPPTNGFVNYNSISGEVLYTPNIDYVGSDSFIFSFPGGTAKACIDILNTSNEVSPFTFVDVTDASLNTLYISNYIYPTGNLTPLQIIVTGGEYSLNDGPFTAVEGLFIDGDSVRVSQISSGLNNTTTSANLTIGNQSDSYDVTTESVVVVGPFHVYYFVQKNGASNIEINLLIIGQEYLLLNVNITGIVSYIDQALNPQNVPFNLTLISGNSMSFQTVATDADTVMSQETISSITFSPTQNTIVQGSTNAFYTINYIESNPDI